MGCGDRDASGNDVRLGHKDASASPAGVSPDEVERETARAVLREYFPRTWMAVEADVLASSERLPYIDSARLTIHRVLAHHRAFEFCDECPYVACRHCGNFGKAGDDHTCPCPFSDDECTEHPYASRRRTPREDNR